MSSADPVIAARDVVKEFGSRRRHVRALAGVNITVSVGEVFGLLGANGAGKTTLVKALLGLTFPTSGEVLLRGVDPRRPGSRARVGYLPEGHRFPDYLSGTATLRLFGRLAGVSEVHLDSRVPELLSLVGLSERAADRVGRYSKGMTQRLGLAAALIDRPDVLFLDEPTDGVDPVGRRHIRDVLLATRDRGTTIFINSHLLSEVERTCNRVAILHQGRVVREGTVEALTRPTQRYRIRLADGALPIVEKLSFPDVTVARSNGAVEVEVANLMALNALIDRLRADGGLIAEVVQLRSDLEDVFVQVVGEEERMGQLSAAQSDGSSAGAVSPTGPAPQGSRPESEARDRGGS